MTQPIVVGVDGSGRSLRALLWAAHHAEAHQCPLRLVYVLPRWDGDFPLFAPGHFEEIEEYGRAALAEAVAVVREAHPDLAVDTAMPMGTPADVLRIEAEAARCIVIGAEGADAGNLVLGSTAVQLVGHTACPVIVVLHTSTGHGRVVGGVDWPTRSLAALDYAFRQAAVRGDRLTVISAMGLPQGWPRHLVLPLPPDDASVAKRLEEIEAAMAPLREHYPDVLVDVEVHHLDPVPTLADASHRADLLVLGSRGRGGFHGLAVGSVTHRLLRFAGCPVAILNTSG